MPDKPLILLDECLPKKLKHEFTVGQVRTVVEMGWSGTKNGKLIALAETQFDVFVTVDQNLRYQQNLSGAEISIVVLVTPSNRLESLRTVMPKVNEAIANLEPGQFVEIND